jgi:hypothetical protein
LNDWYQESKMKRIAIVFSMLFSGLAASNAYAADSALPGAQWENYTTASQNGGPVDNNTSFAPGTNTSSASDASGTSSVTITSVAGPNPYIFAQASSSAQVLSPVLGYGGYAYGSGDLQYWVEVVGPGSGNLIPINVTAYGYASTNSDPAFGAKADAKLWLTFYGQGASPQQYFQAVSNLGAPTSYINVNGSYQAVVGQPIFVRLWTDVQAESDAYDLSGITSGYPYSAANAYIDPYFSLPQWAINDGYQIDLSAGVGNSPVGAPGPVPGAGLASLAFLALAGLAARARGLLAR